MLASAIRRGWLGFRPGRPPRSERWLDPRSGSQMEAPRCLSPERPRFSALKRRAFFQSARRYEVDPSKGSDADSDKRALALQEEPVRGGAMRRRARRHGPKAPPS